MNLKLPKTVIDGLINTTFDALTNVVGGNPLATYTVGYLKQIVAANEPTLIAQLAAVGIDVTDGVSAGLAGITIPRAVFDTVVASVFSAINAAEAGHPLVQIATGWVQSAVSANKEAIIAELANLGVVVQ